MRYTRFIHGTWETYQDKSSKSVECWKSKKKLTDNARDSHGEGSLKLHPGGRHEGERPFHRIKGRERVNSMTIPTNVF